MADRQGPLADVPGNLHYSVVTAEGERAYDDQTQAGIRKSLVKPVPRAAITPGNLPLAMMTRKAGAALRQLVRPLRSLRPRLSSLCLRWLGWLKKPAARLACELARSFGWRQMDGCPVALSSFRLADVVIDRTGSSICGP